jgi:hypothetical protein
MSLYWLRYSLGGAFEGAALVEATSLSEAQERAAADGIYPGGEVEGRELDRADARAIPARFSSRLLSEVEVADLERLLGSIIPKKEPARSVRRSERRRAQERSRCRDDRGLLHGKEL